MGGVADARSGVGGQDLQRCGRKGYRKTVTADYTGGQVWMLGGYRGIVSQVGHGEMAFDSRLGDGSPRRWSSLCCWSMHGFFGYRVVGQVHMQCF